MRTPQGSVRHQRVACAAVADVQSRDRKRSGRGAAASSNPPIPSGSSVNHSARSHISSKSAIDGASSADVAGSKLASVCNSRQAINPSSGSCCPIEETKGSSPSLTAVATRRLSNSGASAPLRPRRCDSVRLPPRALSHSKTRGHRHRRSTSGCQGQRLGSVSRSVDPAGNIAFSGAAEELKDSSSARRVTNSSDRIGTTGRTRRFSSARWGTPSAAAARFFSTGFMPRAWWPRG